MTGAEQAAIARSYLQQGRYAEAYRYIAQQVAGNPAWDQRLPNWFERAADINGPTDNFWKRWVFTFNAYAAGLDRNSASTFQQNQAVSDDLARRVIEGYASAVEHGLVLTPADIYGEDVGSAVRSFGVPPWAWAGGPLGMLYGFPVHSNYDTIAEIAAWMSLALVTAADVAADYVEDVIDYLGTIPAAIEEFFKDPLEYMQSWLLDFIDFVKDIRSDPLVLDLDGDGVELNSLATSATHFDINSDGIAERVAWVSAHDAFLFHDLNGNGIVDGVGELFGSADQDGFDELKLLDTITDGQINALDAAFSDLRVWRDVNSDGVSTPDEVLTLAQAGITGFNLTFVDSGTELAGSTIARTGHFERTNGSIGTMSSVQFAFDKSDARPHVPEGVSIGRAAALPNLPAAAGTPDLHTAMYLDPVLMALVEDLVLEQHSFNTFEDFLSGGFAAVLYRWTGVQTWAPEDPDNPYFLQVLSALTGEPMAIANEHQRERLEDLWPQFVRQLGVRFLVQASNSTLLVPMFDLGDALAALDRASPTSDADARALIEGAKALTDDAAPAYNYLNLFSHISYAPANGALSGDFDAIVRKFLAAQPTFFSDGGGGGGGGGGTTGGIQTGTQGQTLKFAEISAVDEDGATYRHPWVAWFEDQGSLLFNIAAAMGIGPDYVLSVTGWRWLAGEMTAHHGSSASDILDFTVTYYDERLPDGTVLQLPTHDQLLFGHRGTDELRGNDGVDRLVGGPGNDLLKGGSGSDMYVYALGDGLDRIEDQSGDDDAIYFSSEIDSGDLHVVLVTGTNDLQLHFGDASTGIILSNQWNSPGAAVEQFHFVAEDGLDAGDIASLWLATLVTSGADLIVGSWANERVAGLGGDDIISGMAGDDALDGGDGNDRLNGGSGDDALAGRAGDDVLLGESGPDLLEGGAGNDRLEGNEGADTYVYDAGDGDDVISDYRGSRDNSLVLGPGILPAEIVFSRGADDQQVIITFLNRPGSILLENQWWGDAGVEKMMFDDGTIWSEADFAARYVASQKTAGNDAIWGSNLADAADGGAGNDTVRSGNGNDVLIGGAGDDRLEGSYGSDTYVYNAGDGNDVVFDYQGVRTNVLQFGTGITPGDIMFSRGTDDQQVMIGFANLAGSIVIEGQWWGDAGIETISFADGTVWSESEIAARYVAAQKSAGNDTIWGSSLSDTADGGAGNDLIQTFLGSDSLYGGTGNDRLEGAQGSDTYVYNPGDGDDVVFDSLGTRDNRLQFGAGISPGDIVFGRGTDDQQVKISFAGLSGSILLEGQWWSDAGVESIVFADGTLWSEADFAARYVAAQQSAGNDLIWGTSLPDDASGGGGDDVIRTLGGADTLSGGPGNDRLEGGTQSDTYVYNPGGGDDVIFDYSGSRDNVLVFGAGIAPADLLVSRPSGDAASLRISFKETSGSIVVQNQTWGDAGVELFQFADGTLLTEAQIVAMVIPATAGNDVLQGTASPDTIWGLEGADTLSGLAGDDVLHGQDGADRLEGGGGSDVLRGGAGDDILLGDDRVTYSANLVVNGSFEQAGSVISAGSWGQANSTLPGWTKVNSQAFEQVASGYAGVTATHGSYWLDMDSGGGSGSNMDFSQTFSGIVAGQAVILKFDHANRTSASSGSFEVYWNGVLIAAISSTGTSMQTKTYELVSAEGTDTLSFKAIGSADNAGASLDNVRLYAISGASSGSDLLDGGAGNDVLEGGGGADTLTGGTGVDIFRFLGGDSGPATAADRITDFATGTDRIDLSGLDANSALAGDQAFGFVGIAPFSGVAGELRYRHDGGDTWIEGDTDGDGIADFALVLTGAIAPQAADFVL